MTAGDAMQRLNLLMAHAWMVRQFLKHAEEVEDDEEMLEVHRMVFDFIRAVEPAWQRQDAAEYLHRLKGKLPKLKKQSAFFTANFRRVSDHTNFEMAAQSLATVIVQMEEVLAAVDA